MATILMTPVESYPYTNERELPAISELFNTCQIADQGEWRTSVAKLQDEIADPAFDVTQDLRLWRTATGQLVAVGWLWRPEPTAEYHGILHSDVHPQVRGTEVERNLIQWAEQRLRMAGQTTGLPLFLQASCWDNLADRRSLLTQMGFAPERYFFRLVRSLSTPLPPAIFPAGWRVRSVTAQDAEAWVEMFNQTFVDHWNYHPTTIADFRHALALSLYDPQLDLVVEAADGTLASFCYSEIDPEENAAIGRQRGHVCLLGTRRGYRRLGLARSLLLESLHRLQAAGMTTATIGVDAQNPSGALGFYQSVGFERDRSSTVFRKAITGEA